jgi:hypothetical protein
MSKRALRPSIDVCHLCQSMLIRKALPTTRIRAINLANSTRFFVTRHSNLQQARNQYIPPAAQSKPLISQEAEQADVVKTSHKSLSELEQTFGELRSACNTVLEGTERIPSEKEIVDILAHCAELSKVLKVEVTPKPFVKQERKDRAASALLDLENHSEVEPILSKIPPALLRMQDELSKLVYSVIRHPTVFVTPNALALYVKIQSNLKKPETIAGAFHLYANKPLPKEGTSPITYSAQNPDKASNAIPQQIADKALQVAIDKRDLVAAMDLIEFSYATTAYRRAKFIRTGLLPATGLAAAPLAAYLVASQFAQWQTTMEPELATNVAFAGMVAYVGFTGTVGLVALTTANDQMDRVTWTPGLPLRERWIREDERAAIDRVAGAWGFRELWRRGEEEGEEWDAIRELAGLKGMILDRTELMEGME